MPDLNNNYLLRLNINNPNKLEVLEILPLLNPLGLFSHIHDKVRNSSLRVQIRGHLWLRCLKPNWTWRCPTWCSLHLWSSGQVTASSSWWRVSSTTCSESPRWCRAWPSAAPPPTTRYRDRSLFSRVNTCCSNHSLAFPQADVESMAELAEMRHLLMERVQGVMATCCEFRSSLERYGYLYMDDRKEFMRHFLQYGRGFSSQDVEAFAEESLPESPPTLENFREQVDRWVRLRRHVLLCNIWLGFLLRVPLVVKQGFKLCLKCVCKVWEDLRGGASHGAGSGVPRMDEGGRTHHEKCLAQRYQKVELHVQTASHWPCDWQVGRGTSVLIHSVELVNRDHTLSTYLMLRLLQLVKSSRYILWIFILL